MKMVRRPLVLQRYAQKVNIPAGSLALIFSNSHVCRVLLTLGCITTTCKLLFEGNHQDAVPGD